MKRRLQKKIRKKLYEKHLSDLIFEISTHPDWRSRLFESPTFMKIDVTENDLHTLSEPLATVIRQHKLQFVVFNDGWTNEGFVVFGFNNSEFPKIEAYSTNNPDII